MTINKTSAISRIKGVTTAMCTPLDAEGNLDVGALERMIEHQIENGTSCLFSLGWCGEGPLLPDSVRESVIRETCRIAAGRLPVIAGVSEQSLPRALPMVRVAEEAGADYVLATPPYSYEIEDELVFDYFCALESSTSLPLIVYENLEVSVQVGLEGMKRLKDLPGIVGVKATIPPGDLRDYHSELDDPDNFVVMSGDEFLYDYALFLGIRHFTMGGPGAFSPKWCAETLQHAEQGNWEKVIGRQKEFVAFLKEVYSSGSTPYAVTKYIVSQLGLCQDHITSPHRRLTDAEKKTADNAMVANKAFLQ